MDDINDIFGRDLSYSEDKREIYDKLRKKYPLFKDGLLADIFFYAAIMGFKNARSATLKRRIPNIRVSAFSDKQMAILLALAIANTNGVDILMKKNGARDIIEEYANWGIDELDAIAIPGAIRDEYMEQLKRAMLDFSE